MVANLDLEFAPLGDEITSMTREELKRSISLTPGRFDESESIHGGAEDRDEIVIVCFEIAMFWSPIMARSEGVYESRFEACVSKGTHHDQMIAARHFHTHDRIFDIVLLDRQLQCLDCLLERIPLVLDTSGLDEKTSVEIGEHPLGTRLGAVNTDDAKVFGSDILNARLNDARGLSKDGLSECLGTSL